MAANWEFQESFQLATTVGNLRVLTHQIVYTHTLGENSGNKTEEV